MKLNYIKTAVRQDIEDLGSAITIEGLDLGKNGSEAFADWCHGLAKFKKAKPDCYVTSGRVMNNAYGLTGTNAYPDDCNIVSFKLEDFEDYSKMIMPRFGVSARWLNDVVSNNIAAQGLDEILKPSRI